MTTREFNFDGLIGPTHNYAGLSFGNVASTVHQHQPSSPRAAALQGLEKMYHVFKLGVGQCVLPPLRRPRLELLRELGFTGTDRQLIDRAYRCNPALLAVCYSASNMWTANAATLSPSADCEDGRVHLTPANLSSTLHRSIEYPSTTRNLRAIFGESEHFVVHDPLPSQAALADEGAANHTRLVAAHGEPGIELFVYGTNSMDPAARSPKRFPARQTNLASQAIARRHAVRSGLAFFAQQNPEAIDGGVFHNDVISVGNQNVLLCHELSFVDQSTMLESMTQWFDANQAAPLFALELSSDEIALQDAVSSYLFNSQLLTLPDGSMRMICPTECQENMAARRCTERILDEVQPVEKIDFLDLRQSMNNGGGPACLRLRVVLTDAQQAAMHQGVVFNEQLYSRLKEWVNTNYREELVPDDLRDANLIDESRSALDQLAGILDLPSAVLLDD